MKEWPSLRGLSMNTDIALLDDEEERAFGWICPICGNVYSPRVLQCPVCSEIDANTDREIKKLIGNPEDN